MTSNEQINREIQKQKRQRTLEEFYKKKKEKDDGVRVVAFGGSWL